MFLVMLVKAVKNKKTMKWKLQMFKSLPNYWTPHIL